MDSRILASDPITKAQTIFHGHNDDAGSYTIEETQDVTDLVEQNRAQYNSVDERAGWKGNMHRVASIPLVTFFDLWKKGYFRGNKLSKDDKRWLNDSENRFFRTRPGTL
jgi:hypothetical protein